MKLIIDSGNTFVKIAVFDNKKLIYSQTTEQLSTDFLKNLFHLYKINAGHSFIIFLKDAFPINVLNNIKYLSEVCRIFCATSNPVEVIIAETEQGRGILGVIDGFKTKGIETDKDIEERRELLKKIGYKEP